MGATEAPWDKSSSAESILSYAAQAAPSVRGIAAGAPRIRGSGVNRIHLHLQAPMIRFTCYIRPHKLEQVKTAIAALGVTGMSVSDVRGTGNSPEKSTWFAGQEHVVALPVKSKIEVVAPDDLKDALIEAVLQNARTGEAGDGKIFIEKILDAVRVRTLERGEAAV
jgi:nitrogen regulatory protein P-II 1